MTPDKQMTFGQAMYNARKEQNLSQRDVAKHIGATHTTVYFWEIEKTSPNLYHALVIARWLGFSLDNLDPNLGAPADVAALRAKRRELKNQKKIAALKKEIAFLEGES